MLLRASSIEQGGAIVRALHSVGITASAATRRGHTIVSVKSATDQDVRALVAKVALAADPAAVLPEP